MTGAAGDTELLDAVCDDFREQTSLTLVVMGRFGAGESGNVYLAEDNAGHRYVLKQARLAGVQNAASTSECLHRYKYPVPRYRQVAAIRDDVGYALMDELPGEPVEVLTPGLVVQILALIGKQAQKAFLDAEIPTLLETLLSGGDGYALHETMQMYSRATRALLHEVVAIGKRYEGSDFPSRDIVHFDLNPANILTDVGDVTGVVDWEGTRSGDRAFDIATLLFYAEEGTKAEAMLWDALAGHADTGRASAYLAHMMLRQVEWSIRHHNATTVARYMHRSEAILNRLKRA